MTASTTATMFNAAVAGATINTRTGNTYTVDATGHVSVQPKDVKDLLGAGFLQVSTLSMPAVEIPLTSLKNLDGTTLAASPASGKFGLTVTPGTTLTLASEAANNGTITDNFIAEVTLPQTYPAGNNLTLDMNAGLVIGSGTLSTQNLIAAVYSGSSTGGEGSNLVASGATVALTGTADTDYTFVANGTSLVPGQRLLIQGTMNLIETSTHAVHGVLGRVALSA